MPARAVRASDPGGDKEQDYLYFRSVRGRTSSNALERDCHFKRFRTREAALNYQLFKGDNARVVKIPTSPELIQKLFIETGQDIVDLRQVYAGTVPTERFKRGDTDGDGGVDINDPVALLRHLFIGDPPPECPDAADTNDNGRLGLTDSVHTLGWLFLGTPPPLGPGPNRCGPDTPKADGLGECRYDPGNCR